MPSSSLGSPLVGCDGGLCPLNNISLHDVMHMSSFVKQDALRVEPYPSKGGLAIDATAVFPTAIELAPIMTPSTASLSMS